MTKFRVIRSIMEDGSDLYSLQERALFIWFTCEDDNNRSYFKTRQEVTDFYWELRSKRIWKTEVVSKI